MPAIRHDALLLRLLKDVSDIRAALRRVTVNLPLFDVASENTPTQLTGNQNNYVIGNYDILRLSSDSPRTITGLRGGIKGRRLQIFNVGNYTLIFTHQNTLSDAENRFKFNTGLPAFVEPGQNITFYYDDTQQRWIEATNVFEYDIAAVWDTQTTPGGSWSDVAWSEDLGLLVAVAPNGAYVMTSPDGITWTTQAPAANLFWVGIAWSPELGLFAAIAQSGTGNRVMTSPDGIIWTSQASAADLQWQSITWSPDLGLFAAVGSGIDGIMTSPNGVNWTRQTTPNSAWWDIAWASDLGLFVAISTTAVAGNIMTSPDGIVWTLRSKSTSASLYAVVWSPKLGLFVAVSNNGVYPMVETIFTSSNGITWTTGTTISISTAASGPGRIPEMAWAEELGMFLGIGTAVGINYWSSDGIDWSSATGINSAAIVFANTLSLFVAVGSNAAYTTPS